MDTSSSQHIMNRRTKTLLPTKASLLTPKVHDPKLQGKQLSDLKQRQEHYYNRSAHDLKPLKLNDTVRIAPAKDIGKSEEWRKGTVTKVLRNRSYEVQSYRTNRHLRPSRHIEENIAP